jgi:hypothetical protein
LRTSATVGLREPQPPKSATGIGLKYRSFFAECRVAAQSLLASGDPDTPGSFN